MSKTKDINLDVEDNEPPPKPKSDDAEAEHERRYQRARDFAQRNNLVFIARMTESQRLTVKDYVAPWLEAFAEEELRLTAERITRELPRSERAQSRQSESDVDAETPPRRERDGERRRGQDRLVDDDAAANSRAVDRSKHRRRR